MVKKDWCTMWPDRWRGVDFSLCCKEHDEDYARIAKIKSFWKRIWQRRKADFKLSGCVKRKFNEKDKSSVMPIIMLSGVRLFGWIASGLHWKKGD